jgi:hypothetical protein
MMRRLPSANSIAEFAAASSPHPLPNYTFDHAANHYNQQQYHAPNGTPIGHGGYLASTTLPTAATSAAAAAAAAASAANQYHPPSSGTPNGHNGFPTSTTPTAAAILPNRASTFSFSNISAHAGSGNVHAAASGFCHGDAEAWLQSPAATLLVQRCVTAYKWDESLARRALVEYTRFCHLKVRVGDTHDKTTLAPSLVRQVWQTHYLDCTRYMEDIQSICGPGTYLHFNHYDHTDHEAQPRRIQSTETALMAMFGNGGVDPDIWTFYADASTTTAAAAAQTIASRAPPGTVGARVGAGGGAGGGYGTNIGTPGTSSCKHGTPTSITSKHGPDTPSSSTHRAASVLRSSNRTTNTPMTTVSERSVSFEDQFKTEIKKEIDYDTEDDDTTDIKKVGEDKDDATYNDDDDDDDDESIKAEEGSDVENSPEPAPKKRRKSTKTTTKTTPKASARPLPTRSSSKSTPKAYSAGKPKTSASKTKTPSKKASSSASSKSKASSTKADPADASSSRTITTQTNTVAITNWSGDSKSFSVGPLTTAVALRDFYVKSTKLTELLPDSLKFSHNGLPLPKETVLSTLVPAGTVLHLHLYMDLSPVQMDVFDGSIMEL